MEWIIVFIVALVIVIAFANQTEDTGYKYRQRGPLFTKAERSFFGVLEQSIPDEYRVFGKVRVADVLTPEKGMNRKNWQIAFNKISSKHFDYILCRKDTLDVVAAVELDDKSHSTKRSASRDSILNSACESANLKLIRFPAKSGYQVQATRAVLEQALDSANEQASLNKAGGTP